VRRGPARDRLDVWTFVQAGEEIACGDPSVSDAERAAAGRETLSERWQALLEVNRGRAAAQFTAVGLLTSNPDRGTSGRTHGIGKLVV
jgi:hypothetical protein